jgi:hypothetical protein
MIRKIKNVLWYILIKLKVGGVVQLFLASGLKEDGWFESFNKKESIDKDGNPIPWCTYSFIKFIEPRLKKHFKVFEYGSGNSTLWYAKRVSFIKSVEHNNKWFDNNSLNYPLNAKVVFRHFNKDNAYANEINTDDTEYDIIIVDGEDRNNCVYSSINKLSENGIIIFDNTQLLEYTPSIKFILERGFRRLDFEGALPIVAHNNITTIFYRKNNCLNI